MKAVCKKLFSLMLVAILLVSAVPFQAMAAEVSETTEATTAATEAATISEVEATEPAAQAGTVIDPTQFYMYIDFQLGNIIESDGSTTTLPNYLISQSGKTTVTGKVNAPNTNNALNTLAKALGTSNGYEFAGWRTKDNKTFISGSYITEDLYNTGADSDGKWIVDVYADFRKATKTISLNANGGSVSTKSHPVRLGEAYNSVVELPTPTKANCEFLGWYKNGEEIKPTDLVEDLTGLTAMWSSAVFTVKFEKYTEDGLDDSAWAAVTGYDDVKVTAGTVLAVSDGKFPASYEINTLFGLEGWTITGWKVARNGATATADKTKVTEAMADNTGVITIRPVYKKTITLHANDTGKTTKPLDVVLGEAIPALPNPGARDHQAFYSWKTQNGGVEILKADLSTVSKHPKYYDGMGDMEAQWQESVTILLNIYKRNAKNELELVLAKFYEAPKAGFDMSEIDMSGYKNYTKSGWYTKTQWANYVSGAPADNYGYVETPGEEGFKEFYMMITATASSSSTGGNSYNTNNSTADKTNPTTGDQILMAVTVLAVSACALALIFFYKKRQTK